ncbi:Metal-dependent hydrolase, endonuclease/exonuclease/phosphatase family [Pustulibacterium marinum]|uniref:Metal-dependent hydrolase, endonuclease/exonuclease/phosphatase family n=1 Tax=Pustulibacterium marinum TaxID=1224947 RepID=A0A1I7HHN7_9FLAO|nr:endonuclease/exonuclease/phosphatase family protein [Pustulibacterium marinum]SFU60181.1 Metal-dependent hydrolase, endonuclease/exonuclease/phosphatase family [Pustulibacterium marinum]
MKKYIALCLLAFMCTFSFAQELKMMSYNIRYGNENDGENAWSKRKTALVDLINYYSPDVFGTQEGLKYQLDYITENTDYAFVGVGRDNGKTEGEYSAIFYNTQKVTLEKSATFWLSPTPEKPSKGWDAALNRICTYALFTNKKSNQKFYVFNAHFDHVGVKAREEAAKLILQKVKEINTENYAAFVTGDFNLTPESTPIQIFSKSLHDSHEYSKTKPYGPVGTFTGYDFSIIPENRIDYIFTTKNVTVNSYRVISDFSEFKYPSDHLPVFISAMLE